MTAGRLLDTRDPLVAVLRSCRTVAVLGAHHSRWKAAFYVPDYLHQQGMRILPVNPTQVGEILWGEPVRSSLVELDPVVAPAGIDVLDTFRRSEHLPAHLDEILAMPVRPAVVWLQQGIRHAAFARQLAQVGIDVVQDRCMLADHRAWL